MGDPTCETDADCDDGVTNMCFESPIGNYCIFSCQTDEDCDVTEFFLEAICADDETFDSGIKTCQVAECVEDGDCDDGVTNRCISDVELFGAEVPRNICIWSCSSDDDCSTFAGTECTETGELGDDVSTCQPAAVTCGGDSECSDGWECNSLPGADVIGGNVCFPACNSAADCADLGFDSAPCETFSVPFVGSIKYCDVTDEVAEPSTEPTSVPTEDPTAPTSMPSTAPTMEPASDPTVVTDSVDGNHGVRGSVVMAGLCVLAVAMDVSLSGFGCKRMDCEQCRIWANNILNSFVL